MKRGTNRWIVALIAFAVLAGGFGVLIVAAVVVFGLSFGNDDALGAHDLDAATAAEAMEHRGIEIPDGFTFEKMTVDRMFVGADFYRGRYSTDGNFDNAKHALAESNPDFPALRSVACDDEIVATDFAADPQFHCAAGTELAVSTRTVDGAEVLTDNYRGTPPDCETVLLVRNGARTELFVLSQGH